MNNRNFRFLTREPRVLSQKSSHRREIDVGLMGLLIKWQNMIV